MSSSLAWFMLWEKDACISRNIIGGGGPHGHLFQAWFQESGHCRVPQITSWNYHCGSCLTRRSNLHQLLPSLKHESTRPTILVAHSRCCPRSRLPSARQIVDADQG